MIVVDSNVIAYLYLPGQFSADAERLLAKHPVWAAPVLWRSELRNVLALYVRKALLTSEEAVEVQTEAEALLAGAEYDVPSLDVLRLAAASGCSAYDCEYVALAMRLGTRLVTGDKKVIRQFPEIAVSLKEAVSGA